MLAERAPCPPANLNACPPRSLAGRVILNLFQDPFSQCRGSRLPDYAIQAGGLHARVLLFLFCHSRVLLAGIQRLFFRQEEIYFLIFNLDATNKGKILWKANDA
jgi:hypothetical protein